MTMSVNYKVVANVNAELTRVGFPRKIRFTLCHDPYLMGKLEISVLIFFPYLFYGLFVSFIYEFLKVIFFVHRRIERMSAFIYVPYK